VIDGPKMMLEWSRVGLGGGVMSWCLPSATYLQLAEVALSESSDIFLDAESDEFFDVYSDEFFDCVDPMSRAGSLRGVQARS